MLVGEAPGAEEERSGKPFVGPAGKVLDRALLAAGLSRDDLYIANAVKCRPPQNRTPEAKEVDACLRYLIEEIEEVQPKVILCLGNSAMEALTGNKVMNRSRGKQLEPRRNLYIDAPIFATYHPAAVLRGNQSYYDDIIADLGSIQSAISAPQVADDHIVFIAKPGDEMDGATSIVEQIERLHHYNIVSVDLEWTAGEHSKDMVWPWSRRGQVFSISLSVDTEDGVLSVAIGWPPTQAVRDAVVRLLEAKPIALHNSMADLMWMHHERLPYRLGADTMLLSYLLDETQPHDLENTAVKYGNVAPGWKGHLYQKRPRTDEEWNDLLTYNANDTRATMLAFEGLAREIRTLPAEQRDAAVRIHRRLLLPVIPVLMRAAHIGIPIDVELLKEETVKARDRQQEAVQELVNITGLAPLQAMKMANSTDQTQAFIKNTLGIDIANSRKDVLADLQEYPAILAILKIRAERKLLTTYLDPWQVLLNRQLDGRLHSIYKPAGTRTGRLSAENELGGSIHQAPRDNARIAFRKLVRARDGYVILSGDLSQIELRVAGWIANDKTMMSLYQEGADIHLRTAMETDKDATIHTAEMLLMQCGLPPNRTGAEILLALWDSSESGVSPSEILRACTAKRALQESGRGVRWESDGREQSSLERWSKHIQEAPEAYVRAVWQYTARYRSPSGPRSYQSGTLEHSLAVQILSREGTSISKEFPQWKELRQKAKGVNFGLIYSMAEEKLMHYVRIHYGVAMTLAQAKLARDAYFKLYSGLLPWHDRARKDAERTGFTTTPFGRRRHFDTQDVNAAINTPVQSTANDLNLIAMRDYYDLIRKENLKAEIIGSVHDSILVEVHEDDAPRAEQLLKWAMENGSTAEFGFKIPVPIVADTTLGKTWG